MTQGMLALLLIIIGLNLTIKLAILDEKIRRWRARRRPKVPFTSKWDGGIEAAREWEEATHKRSSS
jgi:hypothetical protein